MKKSTRILALILALTLLGSMFSVAGSAYQSYKNAAITTWNDIDKPVFTTEQYASMVLDELDRMLNEEQILLTEDDIFVGNLDITSVNATFGSVVTLVDSASGLLGLLGSAQNLNIDDLKDSSGNPYNRNHGVRYSGKPTTAVSDVEIFKHLFFFINTNVQNDLIPSFVQGSFTLGILNSVLPEINVANLLIGLIYGIMHSGFDAMDDDLPAGIDADDLVQELVQWAVVGDVTESATSPYQCGYILTPDPEKPDSVLHEGLIWEYLKDCDKTTFERIMNETLAIVDNSQGAASAYTFIETLLQDAYNYIAVPELRYVTKPWLREQCGYVYDTSMMDPKTKRYPDDYNGVLSSTGLTRLADIFDVDNLDVPVCNVPADGDTITRNNVTMTVPAGSDATFITYINDYLYEFLSCILKTDEGEVDADTGASWEWTLCEDLDTYDGEWFSTTSYLLRNIANVAKYVLAITGDLFFVSYVDVPDADTILEWTEEETYAFVIRAILNASIDWMYVPETDDYMTIMDVCFEAMQQLTWQDLPFMEYEKPETNEEAVDTILSMLMDIAVYNLNQSLDMREDVTAATGHNPAVNEGSGLLEYSNNYKKLAIQVAIWAVQNFGALLNGYINGVADTGIAAGEMAVAEYRQAPSYSLSNLWVNNKTYYNQTDAAQIDADIDNLWSDLDKILDSLFPVISSAHDHQIWLYDEIGQQPHVLKSIIFKYILGSIIPYNYEGQGATDGLDATGIVKIVSKNNLGTFADKTVLGVVVELVTNVLNTVFPGTIITDYQSIAALITNDELAGIVKRLIGGLVRNVNGWLDVGLYIAAMVIGLTDDQEFEEVEIRLPENINATEATANGITFDVYNACSGLNTAYTDDQGQFYADALYAYAFTGVPKVTVAGNTSAVSASGITASTVLNGGETQSVTLSGAFTAGSLLQFDLTYKIKDETGGFMTDPSGNDLVLTSSAYAYVGDTDKGDDDVKSTYQFNNGTGYSALSQKAMYLNAGTGLGKVANWTVNVRREAGTDANTSVEFTATAVSGVPWLEIDTTMTKEAKPAEGNKPAQPAEYKNKVLTQPNNDKAIAVPIAPIKLVDGYERVVDKYNKVNIKNAEEFAKYGVVDEGGNVTYLYTRTNAQTYTLVATGTAFDEDATYYTRSNNEAAITAAGKTPVNDGIYNITLTLSDGGSRTVNVPLTVFLYNDYGLGTLYENAVAANRQQTDFNTGDESFDAAWSDYSSALAAAGVLVLEPKSCTNFEAHRTAVVGASTGYTSRYAQLYDALNDSTTALDALKTSASVGDLIAIIEANSGRNSNSYYLANGEELLGNEQLGWNKIPYYVTEDEGSGYRYAYNYFGARDYVPHLYKVYRSAKNHAQDIIDSQTLYPPIPPVDPGEGTYEYIKYREAMDAYDAAYEEYEYNLEHLRPVSTVDLSYAYHMVDLTSRGLIPIEANTSKLAAYLTFVQSADSGITFSDGEPVSAGYTQDSFTEFVNAYDFAVATAALDVTDTSAVNPSRVNTSLCNLVESYKKLAVALDLSDLIAAINATGVADAYAAEASYTPESYSAFKAAYDAAVAFASSEHEITTANENEREALIANLNTTFGALEEASSEAVIALNETLVTKSAAGFANAKGYLQLVDRTGIKGCSGYAGAAGKNILLGMGVGIDGKNTKWSQNNIKNFAVDATNTTEGVVVTVVANDAGKWGTGAKIVFTDARNAQNPVVIDEYYIVTFGDVNGDAAINATDLSSIKSMMQHGTYKADANKWCYYIASDTDSNSRLTTLDATVVKNATKKQKDIALNVASNGNHAVISRPVA